MPKNVAEAAAGLRRADVARGLWEYWSGKVLNHAHANWFSSPADFWAWFASLDVGYDEREAMRYMKVAASMSAENAKGMSTYRAYQISAWCEATGRRADEVIARNAIIDGQPLSDHNRASERAAISRANLADADNSPPVPPSPVMEQAKQDVKRYREYWRRRGFEDASYPVREKNGVTFVHIVVKATDLRRLMPRTNQIKMLAQPKTTSTPPPAVLVSMRAKSQLAGQRITRVGARSSS